MKNKQAGFTLVEILVSIALAAVVAASLNAVTTGYLHLSQRSRYLSLANAFAEAKVEALRNSGYNSIALGSTNITGELSTQLPPSRNATLNITKPLGGIKQVDISVSYQDQAQTNTLNYTTYIGELGVGQ